MNNPKTHYSSFNPLHFMNNSKQRRTTLCCVLLACACHVLLAQTTRVELYAPGIVRVTKTDASATSDPMASKRSYSVVLTPADPTSAITGEGTLTTECLTVKVDALGVVSFFDSSGKQLLTELGQGTVTPIATGVDRGKYEVSQRWRLDPDEAIFGLGQRREGQTINQRGTAFRLWNTNTHIYIPYFTSQKGYGIYWDNAGETFWSDDASGTTLRSSVGEGIDYYFLYKDGSQDGVVEQIRRLSGQATMFPLWAYGYWQCRERYKTPDELSGVLDEYRRRDIPIDAIVQDWQYWGCDSNWNAMKFENPHYLNKIGDTKQMRYLPNDEDPDAEIAKAKAQGAPRLTTPQQMVDYVHGQNAHLMITLWPDFGPWTRQYKELDKLGALLPFDTWPRNRGVLVYDVFNPKARDIYWKYLTNLYRMGFDAWWTDSTEPDHFEREGDSDYMTYDGSWRSVKNAFPLVHNRGIYEHQRATKGNNKRQLQMTRSASFGIQHYGTFSWSGDIVSNWTDMQNQVPSGLNYVICGIPMWNTDLGGFFGWDFGNDPKSPYAQELMVRWMQWGTFMPLMRNHCSSPMVSEIWHYGEPGDWAYDVQKHFIELRYRLLPYIYSQAGATVQRSDLMMRPLVMDFADDKVAINRDDEYMFGRALLVKPITQPLYSWLGERRTSHWIYPEPQKAAAPVEVYLPAGTQWWDFWNNQQYEGGKAIKRLAPMDIMPVFVKAGSIIPFGPKVQYSGEKAWDNLEVRIYPGADGNFVLYEDAGDGYGYEQGEFAQIRFHWNDVTRTLTIDAREGNYPGMLLNRQFRIHVVSAASEAGDKEASTFQKTINYDGKAMSITL